MNFRGEGGKRFLLSGLMSLNQGCVTLQGKKSKKVFVDPTKFLDLFFV